jgi:hypothetical protein
MVDGIIVGETHALRRQLVEQRRRGIANDGVKILEFQTIWLGVVIDPFLVTSQSPGPARDSAKAQCVIAATSEVIVKAQLQAEFMRRKGLRLRREA